MSSVESAIYLMVIAYPMVFIVMGLFVALTYLLNKAFPYKGDALVNVFWTQNLKN